MRTRTITYLMAAVGAGAILVSAAPAAASPVASSDPEYQLLGRVFPDPLAGCQNVGPPCSPNAQGNVPAAQFIQYGEFVDALTYMNTNEAEGWNRYMEVWPLASGEFEGNDLDELEFDPKEEYRSAGLPRSDLSRQKSDIYVVRVTDESVPDEGKERYVLSLAIHGIERAGVEGGARAIEDLVTAETTGLADQQVVSDEVKPGAPTFSEVLEKTIIYFTFPNPDGWRRGDVTEGNFFYQRYNGNGVDLNRDWPEIGFSFRPYSALSEPESRALAGFLTDVEGKTGSEFAAGDDLHGQLFADALSYTLLPHGKHDFAKDLRQRATAIAIHRASEEALLWSPIVQPNDAPQGGAPGCVPDLTGLGDPCAQIYGQTWGTVYDTINYTTSGALGDWFDSAAGLGADGIDNEMSFSHLDRNVVFDPHGEQLHVDGNKALIYAHLATIADPAEGSFDAPGRKGYVPNQRLEREEKVLQEGAPPNTTAQDDIEGQIGTLDDGGEVVFPFEVERTAPTAEEPGIYNGGMRIDVTVQNLQGVNTGTANLRIQCKGCDDHPGVEGDDEWITVTEDYNQSLVYLQSGVTAAVNRPQPSADPVPEEEGEPGEVSWRAVLGGNLFLTPTAVARMDVDFTSGPATGVGETGGGEPPKTEAYDVANTDFFAELNDHIPGKKERFKAIDPAAVIGGQGIGRLDSLVLADDPLPGYTGPYGDAQGPTGPPTDDFTFQGSGATAPGLGASVVGVTSEEFPFEIGDNDGNSKMTVRIEWDQPANDLDLYLYRENEGGGRTLVGNSTSDNSSRDANGKFFEQVEVPDPGAGQYVIQVRNWLAANSSFTGSTTFEPLQAQDGGTGGFTVAEKDAWAAALRDFVEGGGNLVLTDGALRILPELTDVPAEAVSRQTVYSGQIAFATSDEDDTLDDPLVSEPASVEQEGARFQSGMRRQTFEPTPVGFSIQNAVTGSDESHARQYDVDIEAFEAAGGRVAGTSADSGERNAQPVFDRVTLGELELGKGRIRVVGALLPQPTPDFDHPLGLEPYGTTYTGYILTRNLLDWEAPGPGKGGKGPKG